LKVSPGLQRQLHRAFFSCSGPPPSKSLSTVTPLSLWAQADIAAVRCLETSAGPAFHISDGLGGERRWRCACQTTAVATLVDRKSGHKLLARA